MMTRRRSGAGDAGTSGPPKAPKSPVERRASASRTGPSRHADLDRLAFERLIADLVQGFADAPAEQLDAAIRDALRGLAADLGVEQISLGQFAADGGLLVTHRAQIGRAPEVPSGVSLPAYHRELLHGRFVQLGRIPEDIPEGWAEERAAFRAAGAGSILSIPLDAGDRVWGAIELFGRAHPRQSRPWSDDEIQRLRLLGCVMAERVRRRESEREERQTREALAGQVAFEDLLARLSAAFVAVPSAGVDDEIDRWLRELTAFLGMDRCSLLQQPAEGPRVVRHT